MDNKALLFQFIKAQSEADVTKIIESHPVLSSEKNWKNYGDLHNIGTITGQNPEPVPSFAEKITNSIDAILIKACKDNGEDPEASSSPRSIKEALKKYFGLTPEKIEDLSNKEKRKLASRIQVIVEGSKKEVNLAIYDDGEGQHPQDLPKTILSLSRGNKQKIHFVQGKYNMGGAAVLPFCGKKGETGYQLVLSKKNIKGTKGKYGFTLIRHNLGIGQNIKSTWYEYFVDEAGKIFEFESDSLDLGLHNTNFDAGTYIKIFNYDLRRKSNATLDLWRDLNRYMYAPALPILIYESRKEYRGHSPTKIMQGNRMRALLDSRDMIEKTLSLNIRSNQVNYPCEVFVFKKEVKPEEFVRDMAMIFTMNGQVQDKEDKRFISGNAKKAYLKDSMLIHVDCSNMPTRLMERVFMSNRSSTRDVEEKRDLRDAIAKELKDNEDLTRIDEQRRQDMVYQNPKDEEFLKRIMGKLLNDDKEIAKLLGIKSGVIGPTMKKVEKQIKGKESDFKGKRFPSVFKFKDLKPGDVKLLPQNGECKILIDTDVEDEYLMRTHDKGDLQIRVRTTHIRSGGPRQEPVPPKPQDDEEPLDVTAVGPSRGSIQLRVKPRIELPVGTPVKVDIQLTSPGGKHELTADIQIDKPNEPSSKKKAESKEQHSLPQLNEIYQERDGEKKLKDRKYWNDFDPPWSEIEICRMHESSQEGTLIDAVDINMDTKELHKYIRSSKLTGKNIERIKRTHKTSVYLISLILFNELSQRRDKAEVTSDDMDLQEEYDPKKLTEFIMNGMAKILLHITTNHAYLKELEE